MLILSQYLVLHFFDHTTKTENTSQNKVIAHYLKIVNRASLYVPLCFSML